MKVGMAPCRSSKVQLDSRLGGAKLRPREQRQTQIDGSGVQRIDCLVQIDPKGLLGVKPKCDTDQRLREFEVDAPVARFVGVGPCAATDLASNAQVVKLGGLRAQACFDVSETLSIGELREGHAQELVQAAEGAHVEIAAVLDHHAAEGMPRRELHDLCEHERASMHRRASRPKPGRLPNRRPAVQIVNILTSHESRASSSFPAHPRQICRTLVAGNIHCHAAFNSISARTIERPRTLHMGRT